MTPWTAACQASLSFTISRSLLKFTSIELMMQSNHRILCHPFCFLPSIFPSIRVFSVSQLFASGGQSIGVSASASVLPKNVQGWFPLARLVWYLCCPRDSQESSPAPKLESMIWVSNKRIQIRRQNQWLAHTSQEFQGDKKIDNRTTPD